MVKKVVPPTPFYLGKRAELFLHDAERALLQGDTTKHAQLMLRAAEYRGLAGQLPLGEEDNAEIQGSNLS